MSYQRQFFLCFVVLIETASLAATSRGSKTSLNDSNTAKGTRKCSKILASMIPLQMKPAGSEKIEELQKEGILVIDDMPEWLRKRWGQLAPDLLANWKRRARRIPKVNRQVYWYPKTEGNYNFPRTTEKDVDGNRLPSSLADKSISSEAMKHLPMIDEDSPLLVRMYRGVTLPVSKNLDLSFNSATDYPDHVSATPLIPIGYATDFGIRSPNGSKFYLIEYHLPAYFFSNSKWSYLLRVPNGVSHEHLVRRVGIIDLKRQIVNWYEPNHQKP